MPRFYFNVYDGKSSLDMEGTELPDWQAARIEAIRLTGEIMKDEANHVATSKEAWRIEVTERSGLVVFEMTFSMSGPPVEQNTVLDQDDAR